MIWNEHDPYMSRSGEILLEYVVNVTFKRSTNNSKSSHLLFSKPELPDQFRLLLDATMVPSVQTITYLEHIQLTTYFDVASVTIFAYDYILTFGLEVSLIWFSPWSLIKVLYLLTRYLLIVDSTLILYHTFTPGISDSQCELTYKSTAWLYLIGFAVAEVILSLRTWAVWGKDIRLSIGLPIFFFLIWIPDFAIMGFFLKSMQFGHPLATLRGCFVTAASPILFITWVLLMVYEAGILALMLIRGMATHRGEGRSALISVVYRDGVSTYLYLFTLSAINVVVILTLPHDYINLLTAFERVIHSILTSRTILHMREQGNLAHTDGLTDVGNSVALQPIIFNAPIGTQITSAETENGKIDPEVGEADRRR